MCANTSAQTLGGLARKIALTECRWDGHDSAMNGHIRPLVASHFQVATDRPLPGTYDASRQLRLDDDGSPIVAAGPVGETVTETRSEPIDPSEPPLWLFETVTKVVAEDPDDYLAMTETETRTQPDPADPSFAPTVILPADDSVTGIVAF
jgi:hypothetical protein